MLIPDVYHDFDKLKYEIAADLGLPMYAEDQDNPEGADAKNYGKLGGTMVKD